MADAQRDLTPSAIKYLLTLLELCKKDAGARCMDIAEQLRVTKPSVHSMVGRKTGNGAYRYRYAPFLMPTYYVTGYSPLALPLGELSPQVTERALQPFLNHKINL